MKHMKLLYTAILTAGLVFAPAAQAKVAESELPEFSSDFVTAQGLKAGYVKMIDGPNGVLIKLDIENVPPGVHGLHLHDIGDCAPFGELSENQHAFERAGSHMNPEKKEHGFLNPNGPHAGDLPNITVPETGKLKLDVFASGIALYQNEDMPSLMDDDGSSLMIHEGSDDYVSDSTGHAGARLACAEIK